MLLTFYSVLLLTTTLDGDPIEVTFEAPFLDDVERELTTRMNEGDRASIFQIDAFAPRTSEEAVAWLRREHKLNLEILVAEAVRVSETEPPIITPTEVRIRGFMYSPSPEAQA